jgi:hypothetical protein
MANSLNQILSKEQIKNDTLAIYHNGLPQGLGINLPELDSLIRWETGRLSVITGVPNYGKSEFLDFITVRLNRLHGWKTLYFSPENHPVSYHLQKLVSKIADTPFDKNKITEAKLLETVEYISANFFFLNYETVTTLDDILACAAQLIHTQAIKQLVIDPYNRLEHQRPQNLTETEYISRILDTLSNFAKRHGILIHLVAHPRKIQQKDGMFDIPTYYDINGSANFANKADYCLAVHRNIPARQTEIHIQKVKFKNLGCQGIAHLKYSIDTGNYYQDNQTDEALDFIFGAQTPPQETPAVSSAHIPESHICFKQNVLSVTVSRYENAQTTSATEINLYQYLKTENKNIDLEKMRLNPKWNELKKGLPAVTVSGLFKDGRKAENLIQHSGLICIDIDQKDQTKEMNIIFNELKTVSNIAYLGRSCSGKGLFAIIPVQNHEKHQSHFLALQKDLLNMGIIIDPACKDLTRLRFYSFDPHAHFNPQAHTYTNIYIPPAKQQQQFNGTITVNDKKLTDTIADIRQNQINIAETYTAWRDLAIIFNNEFGDEGRPIFHAVSAQSKKYDKDNCDAMFDKIAEYHYENKTIASFYYMYNQAKK